MNRNDKSASRNLSVISSLIVAACSLLAPATSYSADASPIMLVCSLAGNNSFVRYLTIDYAANTVTTSDINVTTPLADSQGRTAEPAKVSESQIVWQVSTARSAGKAYAEHFTLNRLTGDLGYYDDGTRHGESWNCKVGEKPKQKF